jgi:UDP-sulfoquinovose synthase
LNIKDTLNCVRLALENPAEPGELRVFNQFTETFSVNELAERVRRVGEGMGLSVEVQTLPNPRKEAEEHYYNPVHTGLIELGLEPNYLTDAVLGEMMETVIRHREGIDKGAIFRGVKW